MVSFAPTILRPRVRIPSTLSTLFSICVIDVESINLTKINKKVAGIGPVLKEYVQIVLLYLFSTECMARPDRPLRKWRVQLDFRSQRRLHQLGRQRHRQNVASLRRHRRCQRLQVDRHRLRRHYKLCRDLQGLLIIFLVPYLSLQTQIFGMIFLC